MSLLERHPIDERRLSRLCAADCDLSAIIESHVDLDVFDRTSVPLHVLKRLAERCRVQADAVLVESPARPDILSDPPEGFRGHRQHVNRHCNPSNDSNKGRLLLRLSCGMTMMASSSMTRYVWQS